jgi:hypothetical protein
MVVVDEGAVDETSLLWSRSLTQPFHCDLLVPGEE